MHLSCTLLASSAYLIYVYISPVTKLYIPHRGRTWSTCPRLIERLNARLHRKLTLIGCPGDLVHADARNAALRKQFLVRFRQPQVQPTDLDRRWAGLPGGHKLHLLLRDVGNHQNQQVDNTLRIVMRSKRTDVEFAVVFGQFFTLRDVSCSDGIYFLLARRTIGCS